MICENTISAGFYFMVGKTLFDVAVVFAVLLVCWMVWISAELIGRKKK